jgi:hypothetical protein
VNLLGDSIHNVKKITETLIHISKEVGLEIHAEKTNYMLLFHHYNAGQNCYIKIADRLFEQVSQFKYLGTTTTNQNLIQEEIKRRLNSGNACCHSVQNLLPSRLLSKNVKIRICKTIILPVVLYGCETWSLILRKEHRLKVFENRVLMRTFGPRSDEVTGGWRKLHNEELHDLYSFSKYNDLVEEDEMGRACRTNGGKRNAYMLLVGKPEFKRPLGRPRRRWVDNIKMDLGEVGWGDVDWIRLAQDRNKWRAVVKGVMNLGVP